MCSRFPLVLYQTILRTRKKKSHGLVGCQILTPILYYTAVLAEEEEEGAYITQLTPKTISLVSWKGKLSWSTVRSLFPLKLWPPEHPALIRGVHREPWKLLFKWWQSQNETPQVYNEWECWNTTYLHGWCTVAKLVSQKNGLPLSITSWNIFTNSVTTWSSALRKNRRYMKHK